MKKFISVLLALCLVFLTACSAPTDPVAPPTDDVNPFTPTDPAPAPGDDSPIPVDPPTNPDPVEPTPVLPDPVDPVPTDPTPMVDPTKPSVGKVQFGANEGQESFNTVEGVSMHILIWVRSLPTDFSDEITLNIFSSDPSVVTLQRCDKLNSMLAEDGRMYVYDAFVDAHGVGTVTLTASVPELNISSSHKVKVDPYPHEESNQNTTALSLGGVPASVEVGNLIDYDIYWENLPAGTDTNVTLTITSSDESVLATGGWQMIGQFENDGSITVVFHSQAMAYQAGKATLTVRINELDISTTKTVEIR